MKTFKATATKLKDGLQVETNSAGFKLIFDEPKNFGGTDMGINPMSAALSVLGACQAITASMFAKSKDIDLQEFSIDIEGDMNLEAFAKLTGEPTGFQEIRYKMRFKSNSSLQALEDFAEFVEKTCPVGNSLQAGVKFVNQGIIKE